MAEVAAMSSDESRMRRLDEVEGIAVPIASAILTVCYPDRFTVLDYRAWDALREVGRVRRATVPTDVDSYFREYLPACTQLSHELGMSLRDLDRALWGWSKRRGIRDVTHRRGRTDSLEP
jgi:hypothetical protein